MALEILINTFTPSSFIDDIYFIFIIAYLGKMIKKYTYYPRKFFEVLYIQKECYDYNLKLTEAETGFTARKHFIETYA